MSGAWGLAGFELAIEDQSGVGEFVFWQAGGGAKEDLGRPAPGESHERHAFYEVAFDGKEVEGWPPVGGEAQERVLARRRSRQQAPAVARADQASTPNP